MDVSRDEYVADLRAIVHAVAAQQSVLTRLMTAMSTKDEIAREKEMKSAHGLLHDTRGAVERLATRVDVTAMLDDVGDDEWDI